MNKKIPFQYAILRYVHDSVTGEFLNSGLAMYSKEHHFFRVLLLTKYKRVTDTFPDADGDFYRRYIVRLQRKFDRIAEEINNGQSSFIQSRPDRIEDLLASVLPRDDSSIQFSSPSGGMTLEIETTFNELYGRLIEAHLPRDEKLTRDDNAVWHVYNKPLRGQNATRYLVPKVIRTPKNDLEFEHAWKNGRWNILQPLSLDLSSPNYIERKATLWLGRNILLPQSQEFEMIYYLLGKPKKEDAKLLRAYGRAKDILVTNHAGDRVELIEEDQAEDFARSISKKIKADTSHNERL